MKNAAIRMKNIFLEYFLGYAGEIFITGADFFLFFLAAMSDLVEINGKAEGYLPGIQISGKRSKWRGFP